MNGLLEVIPRNLRESRRCCLIGNVVDPVSRQSTPILNPELAEGTVAVKYQNPHFLRLQQSL
jgi:hypothetical protein